MGGGLAALQSLSTIKKGISPLNVQSNEPLLEFLRQLLAYEAPLSKKKVIQCAHISFYLFTAIVLPMI